MLEFKLEDETPFPHKEVTEAIIGPAFEVYNHLGYGFLHRVYQRALQVELLRRGFSGEFGKENNGSLQGSNRRRVRRRHDCERCGTHRSQDCAAI